MKKFPLLCWTEKGLYCPAGDFYIDPSKGVDRAVVTHAHSDHARRGSRRYYCVNSSVGLMKLRLGQNIQITPIPYGKSFKLGSVQLSFHSAGHMLGSAQVRLELDGEVWVVSGDYKREADPTCPPFEVVPCDIFVTEATFGTPSFAWEKSLRLGQDMHDWWQLNRADNLHSLFLGYSIGKSQRIMGELLPFIGDETVWIHPTLEAATLCYRAEGVRLPTTEVANEITLKKGLPRGSLLIAPPSVQDSPWTEMLGKHRSAFASGWMSGSGRGPGRYHETGFVMSDHADWPDLLRTIEESGAKRIYVLHRGTGALVRYLRGQGLEADPIEALHAKSRAPAEQLRLI